jgi:tetratricopeptide (TPR) repeat protein
MLKICNITHKVIMIFEVPMRLWSLFLIVLLSSCTSIKKAQQSYDRGNYRETIKICLAELANDSINADVFSLLGESYYKLQQPDSCVWAASNAVKLDSTSKSRELIYNIYSAYGDSLMEKKEYRKAIYNFDKVLQYYPQQPIVLEKIADAYYLQCRYDSSLEKYENILPLVYDSTALIEKINKIKISQNESDKRVESGINFLDKKNYKNANQEFAKALELKPDNKNAKFYLYMTEGHIHYKQGNLGALWDAIKQYGLASALAPKSAGPHYFMGLSYHRKDKKEYENAFREFEMAIKLEPDGKYAKLASEKLAIEQQRKKLLEDFWNKGKK